MTSSTASVSKKKKKRKRGIFLTTPTNEYTPHARQTADLVPGDSPIARVPAMRVREGSRLPHRVDLSKEHQFTITRRRVDGALGDRAVQ